MWRANTESLTAPCAACLIGTSAPRLTGKKIKQLKELGIDEISRLKGHSDFVTVVSAHDKQGRPVLLAILEGREKATVLAFLKSIPKRLRNQVEQVCCDLYEGFANAVKEALPNAKVVADRFHVAKLYRGAVDDLRKREMKELKRALKPEEYDGLKGVMWLLRRKSEDLTTEELGVLELLFDCSCGGGARLIGCAKN